MQEIQNNNKQYDEIEVVNGSTELDPDLEYAEPDKKGMFNRKKYKNVKAPLKKLRKEKHKQAKDGRPHMAFIGLTVAIMIICLFIYAIAYLVSPQYSLEATITVTKGGYNLVYDITSIPVSYFEDDLKVGDKVYVNQYGIVCDSPKDSLSMTVVKIEDSMAILDFNVTDIPTFIDTTKLKTVMQTEKVYGKQISEIYLNGKVIGGRFVLSRITLSQQSN